VAPPVYIHLGFVCKFGGEGRGMEDFEGMENMREN